MLYMLYIKLAQSHCTAQATLHTQPAQLVQLMLAHVWALGRLGGVRAAYGVGGFHSVYSPTPHPLHNDKIKCRIM